MFRVIKNQERTIPVSSKDLSQESFETGPPQQHQSLDVLFGSAGSCKWQDLSQQRLRNGTPQYHSDLNAFCSGKEGSCKRQRAYPNQRVPKRTPCTMDLPGQSSKRLPCGVWIGACGAGARAILSKAVNDAVLDSCCCDVPEQNTSSVL